MPMMLFAGHSERVGGWSIRTQQNTGSEEAWPPIVKPNLAGQVFTDHLIPMPVADRTLSWLYNSGNKMELRYFTHSNSKAKRQRRQKIRGEGS